MFYKFLYTLHSILKLNLATKRTAEQKVNGQFRWQWYYNGHNGHNDYNGQVMVNLDDSVYFIYLFTLFSPAYEFI